MSYEYLKGEKMAEADNGNGNFENTAAKKKRGRPVGSKNSVSPFKRKAEEILKRSLTNSLDALASRKKNNLEDMIIEALDKDILNINKLAFLFPKEDTLKLTASDTFTGALTDVANRIKDYKTPSIKQADAVIIDNNITDIESD
tara:strand:- start:5991 stop:6422 length:432 start_codon:yes stop_codon:yes gene_type:complete